MVAYCTYSSAPYFLHMTINSSTIKITPCLKNTKGSPFLLHTTAQQRGYSIVFLLFKIMLKGLHFCSPKDSVFTFIRLERSGRKV